MQHFFFEIKARSPRVGIEGSLDRHYRLGIR